MSDSVSGQPHQAFTGMPARGEKVVADFVRQGASEHAAGQHVLADVGRPDAVAYDQHLARQQRGDGVGKEPD